nr:uncharacterized protein LOC110364106 isoform X5 [Columba livia]
MECFVHSSCCLDWCCWRSAPRAEIAAENGSVSIISVRHLAECGKKMILISSVLHPKKRFHEAQHLTAAFNTARYITDWAVLPGEPGT